MNIETGSQSSCFANVSFSIHAFQTFQLCLPTTVVVIGVKRRLKIFFPFDRETEFTKKL